MKFSEAWLRAWIDPPVSTEELAEQMTLMGLEVDTIESARPEFSGVVVAEIINAGPHPNADTLQVCEVNAGLDEPVMIVCGAPNARKGLRAPLAMVGARLPGGHKIRKSKLRGEISHGMLCSGAELSLADEADGLMELPEDAPVGTPLEEYLALNDHILDVELTPNRGDCLSIRGLARDLSARNQLPINELETKTVSVESDAVHPVRVDDHDDNACVRYTGRVVQGIDASSTTPLWMSERLRRGGVRTINPAVDITNYVMLEIGQPMHAFDLDKLQGAIQVRLADAGEKLVLLDGREVELDADMTVIADDSGAIGIAGIMGGLSTAVDENTRNIFFESALFLPAAIAGKPWRLDAHTDSSHRFERGVDPDGQLQALDYATWLCTENFGGQAGPAQDWVSKRGLPIGDATRLRRARIERVLGEQVDEDVVTSILQRLGIHVDSDADGWQVTPPSHRYDLRIEEDYIEEIARIRGYDSFARTMGSYSPSFQPVAESVVSETRLKQALVDCGYQEVVTFSFVDEALQQQIEPDLKPVMLSNPLSADLSAMRTSLVPGLLNTLKHNANRQNTDVKIFEVGLRYIPQDVDKKQIISQEKRLGGLVSGRRFPEQWNNTAEFSDFYDIKGDFEVLLGLAAGSNWELRAEAQPFLHPGQALTVYVNGENIGWIGLLHPQLQKSLDLSQSPLLFEIAFEPLTVASVPKYSELSRYPSVRRDLALVLPQETGFETLRQCVVEHAPDWLQSVNVFDVYSGTGIEPGMKSVALGLILQDFSRTLEESEIDQAIQRILAGLNQDLGVTLRV